MPTTDHPPARVGGRGSISARGESGRVRLTTLVLIVVVVVAGVGIAYRLGAGPFPDPPGCTANVAGERVELSSSQAESAGTIAAVAVGRGLPARAVSIALAAAFQESKLHNIGYGDRDSVGLFQQRPSQGWGTRAELRDPVFATNAFYDALQKVDGYESMSIAQAAQAVQRSGYPEAYAQHAAGARALASALTGYSPARFSCVVGSSSASSQRAGSGGLTPRAQRVRDDLSQAFGAVTATPGPGAEGRTLEVSLPSGGDAPRAAWAVASYLVAQAGRLDLARVAVADRVWSATDSHAGWRRAASAAPAGKVLVEVVGGS